MPKVTLWAGSSARPPQPAFPTQRSPALEHLPPPGAWSLYSLTWPIGWMQREQGPALCPHALQGIGDPTLIQEARSGSEQERIQLEALLLVPSPVASQTWTWPTASSWALGAPCRPRAPGGTRAIHRGPGPGKGSTQTGLRSQCVPSPSRCTLPLPLHHLPTLVSPLGVSGSCPDAASLCIPEAGPGREDRGVLQEARNVGRGREGWMPQPKTTHLLLTRVLPGKLGGSSQLQHTSRGPG